MTAGEDEPKTPAPTVERNDATNAIDLPDPADDFPIVTRIPELRKERRVPLQLKTALVYHQHADAANRPTFHGTSHDISTSGLTLVVDHNVFTDDDVTVLIALPPPFVGADKKIIEATAKMIYTVYTSDYMAFRIGLIFKEFKRDGQRRLQEAVESTAYF